MDGQAVYGVGWADQEGCRCAVQVMMEALVTS